MELAFSYKKRHKCTYKHQHENVHGWFLYYYSQPIRIDFTTQNECLVKCHTIELDH